MPQRPPTRLLVAVCSTIAATLLIAVVAVIRTGFSSWIGDVIRPAGLVLFTVLALRGKAWARWVLIAWLGLSALAFFASVVAALNRPIVLTLFVGMALLYIWSIVELTQADIYASEGKRRES